MGFKESLQEDIDNVFINLDEFADINKVNGSDMPVIIDDQGLEEFNQKRDGDYDGIYKSRMMFFVKLSDLGYKPAIESILEIDDRQYRVIDVNLDDNILKIIVGWNED